MTDSNLRETRTINITQRKKQKVALTYLPVEPPPSSPPTTYIIFLYYYISSNNKKNNA